MHLARPVLAAVASLGLCAAVPSPKQARLVYERQPGAEKCPDEESLRIAVAGRLGHSPFDDAADRAVRAAVSADSRGLSARVEILDSTGQVLGARDLASPSRDCQELGAAMALAIALALDPLASVATPSAPPPVPAVAPSPPPPADVPAAASTALPVFSVSLGGLVSFGSTPAVTGGIVAGGRARWGLFSVGLEAWTLLPRGVDVAGGSIEASVFAGSVVPCLHYSVGFGCVTASAGALRATGVHLANATDTFLATADLGARLGAEIPISGGLALRVQGELLVPLSHTSLLVGEQEAWRTPVIAGAAGLALSWTFQTDSPAH